MAPDFSRRFRVRSYECDAYGHLNNANYLRYRQATDETRLPTLPLVREGVEYFRPLEPADDVLVECFDDDVAPGYERRTYRFVTDRGEAAKAYAEWAADTLSDRGDPLAEPPPAPPGEFAIELPIEWRDVGVDGRVNPATLAALAEHCGIRVVAAHGWPMERCTKAGFAIVLRRLQIEHIGPAHLEDEIRVRTWVSDPRRSMITRHYVLSRSGSGKPVALVRTLYVWIDLETGRPVRVPDAFLADFAPNFA